MSYRSLHTRRSSSDGEPGVLLCVRNFPIEHVRVIDTCSNMAAIINNNFSNVNPRVDLPKLHGNVENIIPVFHAF